MMNAYTKLWMRNLLIGMFPKTCEFLEQLRICILFSSKWRRNGWTGPLPYFVKRCILRAEAIRFQADTFVETGTYLGDTTWFHRHNFKSIITIEVQPDLALLARKRFRRFSNVTVVEGDSGDKLGTIVKTLRGKCLFWLDGHYDAGITGRGIEDCPIYRELDAIRTSCEVSWLIMIDDARLFGQSNGYPRIADVMNYCEKYFPSCRCEIKNDIIYICDAKHHCVTTF